MVPAPCRSRNRRWCLHPCRRLGQCVDEDSRQGYQNPGPESCRRQADWPGRHAFGRGFLGMPMILSHPGLCRLPWWRADV